MPALSHRVGRRSGSEAGTAISRRGTANLRYQPGQTGRTHRKPYLPSLSVRHRPSKPAYLFRLSNLCDSSQKTSSYSARYRACLARPRLARLGDIEQPASRDLFRRLDDLEQPVVQSELGFEITSCLRSGEQYLGYSCGIWRRWIGRRNQERFGIGHCSVGGSDGMVGLA